MDRYIPIAVECREQSANCEDIVLSEGIFNHIILNNFLRNTLFTFRYIIISRNQALFFHKYIKLNDHFNIIESNIK